jgi:hypothetical protein
MCSPYQERRVEWLAAGESFVDGNGGVKASPEEVNSRLGNRWVIIASSSGGSAPAV